MTFKQADPKWREMIVGLSATMGGSGCVECAFTNLLNFIRKTTLTPDVVLRELRKHDGVFVNLRGDGPGNLMVWPKACELYGLACDDAVAHQPDHEDDMHDFGGQMVDGNIDLAQTAAAGLLYGGVAIRVDTDGDGKGDHTIACIGRDNAGGFVCDDSALGQIIVLDPNLEGGPETKWDKEPYRAVGVRSVYAKTA